jgi:hypothetical protein
MPCHARLLLTLNSSSPSVWVFPNTWHMSFISPTATPGVPLTLAAPNRAAISLFSATATAVSHQNSYKRSLLHDCIQTAHCACGPPCMHLSTYQLESIKDATATLIRADAVPLSRTEDMQTALFPHFTASEKYLHETSQASADVGTLSAITARYCTVKLPHPQQTAPTCHQGVWQMP